MGAIGTSRGHQVGGAGGRVALGAFQPLMQLAFHKSNSARSNPHRPHHLIPLSFTRWVSTQHALEVQLAEYPALVGYFDEAGNEGAVLFSALMDLDTLLGHAACAPLLLEAQLLTKALELRDLYFGEVQPSLVDKVRSKTDCWVAWGTGSGRWARAWARRPGRLVPWLIWGVAETAD